MEFLAAHRVRVVASLPCYSAGAHLGGMVEPSACLGMQAGGHAGRWALYGRRPAGSCASAGQPCSLASCHPCIAALCSPHCRRRHAENVDAQRGGGVFRRSIRGLQLLNAAGYGRPGTGLVLDLVYNPGGVFLAPPQATLEPAYKQARLLACDAVVAVVALGACALCRRRRRRRPGWPAGPCAGPGPDASLGLPPAAVDRCRSWSRATGSSSTPCCASTTCPSSAGWTSW